MNKKNTTILVVSVSAALVLATAGLTVGLVIAAKNNKATTDTFDTEHWEVNKDKHWHKCTTEGKKDSVDIDGNESGDHVDENNDKFCDVCHLPLEGTAGLNYREAEGGL